MSERYEREIEEIIRKSGADLGPRVTLRQAFRDLRRRARVQMVAQSGYLFRWVTPMGVGMVGATLLVAGFLMRHTTLTILALSLLLVAYLISVLRSSRTFKHATGYERTWRGRSVETRAPSRMKSRLRRWLWPLGRRPVPAAVMVVRPPTSALGPHLVVPAPWRLPAGRRPIVSSSHPRHCRGWAAGT